MTALTWSFHAVPASTDDLGRLGELSKQLYTFYPRYERPIGVEATPPMSMILFPYPSDIPPSLWGAEFAEPWIPNREIEE